MLHNADHKLIDPEQGMLQSPISVDLPAEVVSDAIIGAFQQLVYSNPITSQKEATRRDCHGNSGPAKILVRGTIFFDKNGPVGPILSGKSGPGVEIMVRVY